MKPRLFTGAVALSVLTLISSCRDHEKEMGTISQEDGKVKLQENGLALSDELEALKDVKAADAALSFDNLMQTASFPSGRTAGASLPSFMTSLSAYSKGEITISEFASSLRTSQSYTSISQVWNDYKGVTYTWNFGTQSWDETANSSKFIVNFPSTESGTTNDAVFTIQNYTGVAIKNQSTKDDLEYDGDLPGEFLADLVIGGTKELEYSLKASYDAQDIPSDIKVSYLIRPFKLSMEYSHSDSNLKVAYSLTSNDKTLLAVSNELTGNLDYESISEAVDSEDIGIVNLETEKYHVQLMNVKVETTFNNLNTVLKEDIAIYEDIDNGIITKAEAADKLEKLYNDHSTILAYFTDSNQKIADGQFNYYVESNWGYDELNLSIELVFNDGSKVAVEDYFQSGFESVETEFNNLADDLDAEYGN